MKAKTAFNKKRLTLGRIKDLYLSIAPTHKWDLISILEVQNKYLREINNCPLYIKEYIGGAIEILAEEYYKHLEYCFIVKGQIVTINKDSDRYYEKLGITPEQLNKSDSHGYYYKNSDVKYS